MKIVIRADANKSIGMGHIMRCLSIADAFHACGHNAFFLIADDEAASLICERGYEPYVLHSDYKDMEAEIPLWPKLTPDIIIIDSYYVTAQYFRTLRDKLRVSVNNHGKLVYIDDISSFPYPVDVLVDYNAYAAASIYEKLYYNSGINKPRFILGPTYAPLRSMFRGIPKRSQPESVRTILFSTGGSDELHLTLSILRFLLDSRWMECNADKEKTYHILLGAMNVDKDEIKRLTENDDHIVLHENVSDMKSLICACDLVISAAGTTLYEICACGVPLITYSLADNQIYGAEAFERLGLGVSVGDLRDLSTIDSQLDMSGILDTSAVKRLMNETEKLAHNYQKRSDMSTRMQGMIDGYGADRIVGKLL